jgi:hypothetical protein
LQKSNILYQIAYNHGELAFGICKNRREISNLATAKSPRAFIKHASIQHAIMCLFKYLLWSAQEAEKLLAKRNEQCRQLYEIVGALEDRLAQQTDMPRYLNSRNVHVCSGRDILKECALP